jgi:hypothetical protein
MKQQLKLKIMETLNRINELKSQVKNANTANVDERQLIANACKELYNLIEEDVYNAGSEWMLKGMYTDLCNGNFAEPFMCEQKKTTFETIVKVYEDKILPRL